MHKIVLIAFGAVLLFLGGFVYQQKNGSLTDNLSFSSTQTLGAKYYDYLNKSLTLVPNFYSDFNLLPPPTNTSAETMNELAYLHQLATSRTEADVANITATIDLATTQFNNQTIPALLDTHTRPRSHKLVFTALEEFNYIVMEYKVKFDRIRPTYLDPTLTTVISVPNHPAYPSGHAAQSMLIALILSDLDSQNSEHYKNSAFEIAHYREVAGVHYPSDSIAGQELAEAYFQQLKTTAWYQNLLREAVTEW